MATTEEARRLELCASYELVAERFVRSTTRKLLAQARSCGLDIASSEDVVQDAFILLFEKRPQLQNIEAWLVCVVRRRCSDWLRAELARERALERSLRSDVDARSQAHLERIAVRAACAQLSPRHRALVSARFFAGHSEDDAARAVGYSPTSFKKTMTRILSRLRALLEEPVEPLPGELVAERIDS